MNLGADIAAALPEMRAAAKSMMTDTAQVHGLPVKTWNETTSSYDMVAPLVYTGPSRVKIADALVQVVDAQSQQLAVQRLTASFPVAQNTVFPESFTVKIIASQTDEALVDRIFRITGPHSQTHSTARRYPVEETT